MKEKIEKMIKEGWILADLWFEVLAIKKEAAERSLKNHVKKLEEFEDVKIVEKSFKKTKKVRISKDKIGYSKISKVRLLAKNIEALIFVTIMFGPSAIEIIKPEKFEFSLATVQSIVNTFADLIHRFAAIKGGMIIPVVHVKK